MADYDENGGVIQGDPYGDGSNDVQEDNKTDYDPYDLPKEASPLPTKDTPEQSNYQASDISENRGDTARETAEDNHPSVQHTSPPQERNESPQTSQDPNRTECSPDSTAPFEITSPTATQTLRRGAQEGRLENFNNAHIAMTNGSQSPIVKTEEQDDDGTFLTSNTREEPIVISDDEDMVEPEPKKRTIVVDTAQDSSDGRTASYLSSGIQRINMGNSILRTRTTQRKPTKTQMEMMKQAQQVLAKQFTRKPVAGGSGTVFKWTAGHAHFASGIVETGKEAEAAAFADENSWMNDEMDDNSDGSVNSVA